VRRAVDAAFDDRLIVKLELVALDGPPELGLRRPAGHRPLVHLGVEQTRAALASLLGLVERDVRVAQHLLGAGVAGSTGRDSDAPAGDQIVDPEAERL